MKTTSLTHYEKIVIENIDLEPYGIVINEGEGNGLITSTTYDKIKEVYNIFKKEYIHNNNKHLDEIYLFSEWLRGLPSVLTVPFYNGEILEGALLSGFDVSTEAKENKFLNEYWMNLSKAFFTLRENL